MQNFANDYQLGLIAQIKIKAFPLYQGYLRMLIFYVTLFAKCHMGGECVIFC